MNKIINEATLNGDLHTVLKGIDYSTSPREVVTVGDMIDYETNKRYKEFGKIIFKSSYGKQQKSKIEVNSIYGLNVKGAIFDERI